MQHQMPSLSLEQKKARVDTKKIGDWYAIGERS